MILLDGLTTKLFISEKPNNPPIDLYMTGIIRVLEKQREEDLSDIEQLKSVLKHKKTIIKGCNESIDNMSFQLDKDKVVIESQKAVIKHLENIAKTQETQIEELQSRVIRWKNKSDKLRKANFKLRLYSPGSNGEYLAEALHTEREKRLQLQITLSSVTELVRRLNNVIA